MRVLACGDRYWDDKAAITKLFADFPKDTIIIHGGADGADNLSGEVAKEFGLSAVVYPAQWSRYGRAAGPIRNSQMLTEGKPDIVYAFHADISRSRGTIDTIKKAEKLGIKVILVSMEIDDEK